MATEAAQPEVPAPAPPAATGASPQKRERVLPVPAEGGEVEHPPEQPKRRRARVAALDCVTTAASGPGPDCDASFSFQHARRGFVALETTPKFGSFNPPAVVEQAGLDVKPAPPDDGEDVPDANEQVAASSSAGGAEDDGCKEQNSHSQSVGVEAGAGGGQGQTDENDDPLSTC